MNVSLAILNLRCGIKLYIMFATNVASPKLGKRDFFKNNNMGINNPTFDE